jgi:hypothetical protein
MAESEAKPDNVLAPVKKPKRKRTAEEQQLIDMVAKSQGKEWAEAHAQLIIDQAIFIGSIYPHPEDSRREVV